MKYNQDIHHRRSIRLKEYDYSQAGLYFITICTEGKVRLFGEIKSSDMVLNDAGLMINRQWQELTHRFEHIKLHEFIVMPNHFHGIIEFIEVDTGNQTHTGSRKSTVGDVVGAFKSLTTNEYIVGVKDNKWKPFSKKLWQRNYHEHIIRDYKSYNEISEYVQTNSLKWQDDKYYE